MQLIEFETRLEKTEEWERNPYKFTTYARVSLNVGDAKDIELIKTKLPDSFLESINWEEGTTAFFEPFYLFSSENRFRKEETIGAYVRLANKFNKLSNECDDFSDKGRLLDSYNFEGSCIERQLRHLKESLETYNEVIEKCISTLSSDECKLLGIKDCYPETISDQINDLFNTVKDSPCTDDEVIASLESAYSQCID
jgi:hypothetical protein